MTIMDRIRARRERNAAVNDWLAHQEALIPSQLDRWDGIEPTPEQLDRLAAMVFAADEERVRAERRPRPHRVV